MSRYSSSGRCRRARSTTSAAWSSRTPDEVRPATSMAPAVEELAYIEKALRYEVEHQHASLLEAAVERTIRQSVAAHIGRLGDLVVRAVLDSDETRRLVLTLLVKEIGPEQTRMFRREAHSASWQRLKEPLSIPPEQHGPWPATPARS